MPHDQTEHIAGKIEPTAETILTNKNDANEEGNTDNTGYWDYLKSSKITSYIPYLSTTTDEGAILSNGLSKKLDNPENETESMNSTDVYRELKNKLHLLSPTQQINKFFDLLINKKIVILFLDNKDLEKKEIMLTFLELSNILINAEPIDINTATPCFLETHYRKLIDLPISQYHFKDIYQSVILEIINEDLKNLEEFNNKELFKSFNIFNADNYSAQSSVQFSTITEVENFSASDAGLRTFESVSNKPNENTFFNVLNSLQGTFNSVYTRNNATEDSDECFIEDNNADKMVIQIYEKNKIRLLLENSLSWHMGGIYVTKEYQPLTKYQASMSTDHEFTSETSSDKLKLQIDDSILLPSSNINDYFHKRSIWSKLGASFKDYYKFDYGDLHLYLNKDSDDKDTRNKTLSVNKILSKRNLEEGESKQINNLIIQFNIANTKNYGAGGDVKADISAKFMSEGLSQQLEHHLRQHHSICNENDANISVSTKTISIDIPAVSNASLYLDRLLERLQGVFVQLLKQEILQDIDNLFFATNGESFNLLVLLLPYLKNILNLTTNSKMFPYERYPTKQTFFQNSKLNLRKIGILGIDINPQTSPLYAFNDTDNFFARYFKDALTWCLQSNIKISLVATLYDCKQFTLSDKLLIDYVHPNIVRGVFVQNQLPIYDTSDMNFVGEDSCILKAPTNRQFEIKLVLLLLTCLNAGYVLNDTIPLLKMIEINFQSRAFNKHTVTNQLRKKWEKVNREFVSQVEKTHAQWQNISPEFVIANLTNDFEKIEFLFYWLAKQDLGLLDQEIDLKANFEIKKINVFEDFKVFSFFINNSLFTTDPYPNKSILTYDYRKVENALLNEEEKQFMLIWKLRDFLTNLSNVRNLSSALINTFSQDNYKDIKIIDLNGYMPHTNKTDTEALYNKNNIVARNQLVELFNLYLCYTPPPNNKNLTNFKKDILDMIWDNYENSYDFLEDLCS